MNKSPIQGANLCRGDFFMKIFKEYAIIYCIGSVSYSLLEIIWRGFTHWTMSLTGGACFLCFYIFNNKKKKLHLVKRCLSGCGIITFFELVVGCVVNRILHWNVWDYSHLFGNILGQICILYSFFWFILCAPMTFLCKFIKKNVFFDA